MHHPPMAAFQLYGRGFIFQGYLETLANMHANSVNGQNYGDMTVTFLKSKNKITLSGPPGTLYGTGNVNYILYM